MSKYDINSHKKLLKNMKKIISINVNYQKNIKYRIEGIGKKF